jgi:hypothetical protein
MPIINGINFPKDAVNKVLTADELGKIIAQSKLLNDLTINNINNDLSPYDTKRVVTKKTPTKLRFAEKYCVFDD